MICESMELALGQRPRTQEGVGQGLSLTFYTIVGTRLHFFPDVLVDQVVSPCYM